MAAATLNLSAYRWNPQGVVIKAKPKRLLQITAMPSGNPSQNANGKKALLIGITGVTGRSAMEGILASPGASSLQLAALTRSTSTPSAAALQAKNVHIVAGDLDDPTSLAKALEGVELVYCHALSTDAAKADPLELQRAQRLAQAANQAGVQLIAYNSSGGKGCGYGISQMEQKHQVEDILSASVPLTALRATLFMEEWWKKYTRPSILKGSFPMSVPSEKPMQLLSARDIGLAAGTVLADASNYAGKSFELAFDELTPAQMCEAFGKAQNYKPAVKHSRPPAWLFWFFNKDLYRITRFLSERGFSADVQQCRQQFPGALTFAEFLDATGWGDISRSYDQGICYDRLAPVAVGSSKVHSM